MKNLRLVSPLNLFLSALAILVCLLAITSRSFWIDEASTAAIAQQPTLQAATQKTFSIHGSEIQMPLFVVWTWACEKVVGNGELALRSLNAFWFLAAMLVLISTQGPKRRPAIFFTAAFSPFVWYYLNEARPYAMEFGAGMVLFGILFQEAQNPLAQVQAERIRVYGFAIALIVLGGSSLLGMVMAAAPLMTGRILLRKERLAELSRSYLPLSLVTGSALIFMAAYYLGTLHAGAGASKVGGTNWKNILFSGYELLGFDGLGPGRLQIRDAGIETFKPFALILFFYGALVFLLLAMALAQLWRQTNRKVFLGLMATVALPVIVILAAGINFHFRVLGRHFAPLLPVVAWLLALGLVRAWSKGIFGKALVAIFIALYLASALSIRFAVRHQKDDYRRAVAIAKAALLHGQAVWWNADEICASYYQLPLTTNASSQTVAAFLIRNPWEIPAVAQLPDMVIASRPDVFDNGGRLAQFLAREHYAQKTNLPAFTIWERTPP